jgi:UDP-hydrolysing UDP-N-acetyl-D-glucosamine 2-epimerase
LVDKKRTIGVVTTGRADYGIYLPILRRIQKDPLLKLHLIVAGMHWLPRFGETVEEIRKDGFEIGSEVRFSLEDDSPKGIATAAGTAVAAFAKSYETLKPDLLLVLGDRFEMHAAVTAAIPFKIPVAHIHGGELTLGAIDNIFRHSITLSSHLHFVAADAYAKRVLQLGEEPWRVSVTGAPALDHLKEIKLRTRRELSEKLSLPLDQDPFLVTFHPVTLEYEKTEWQMGQLLESLSSFDRPIVFTGANADTGNGIIWRMTGDFVKTHPQSRLVSNLGVENYFSMMAISAVMIGNSSSGLIEAASFELPVVNIGTRQEGRIRAKNVIDVGYAVEEIKNGIKKALSDDFHNSLKNVANPYGDGKAAEKIVSRLKEVPLNDDLIKKRFLDRS